jgi:hypothetical protein
MTDNQRLADDELTAYKEARQEIQAIRRQLEVLETRCNRVTRASDAAMQDTGRKDEKGNKILVLISVKSNNPGNGVEMLLDALMEHRRYYMAKQADAERLCMSLEVKIARRCRGALARVLSMYYLYNVRLEGIAVALNYSYAQVKRLRWRALEQYGKMIPNEP